MPPRPPSPPAAAELRQVDSSIWKACTGTSSQIHTVNSRVYYFPQGHLEQCSAAPNLSPIVFSKPAILCRILAVHLLADPITDEVFERIGLQPITNALEFSRKYDDNEAEEEEEGKVIAFAKILTPSDANNGGGFSVPRFCADLIFPALNYQVDPPVQTLSLTDIHGVVYNFRHIYRGTPRRHLLTTGWSKFVNHKKLVSGDSVVFMRNSQSGELSVGIRRGVRPSRDCRGTLCCQLGQIGCGTVKVEEEGFGRNEGFWRAGKGRVSAESVVQATELAARGLPFEIEYYPRAGSLDFVVKAKVVEEAMNVFWNAGVRVKLAMETEDSSRLTWLQGTVSSALIPDAGPWAGSPWRMLQVEWDEPDILPNVKRVNPWQVEYVQPTQAVEAVFHPMKKSRAPQDPGDGERELSHLTGLSRSITAQISPWLLGVKTFPAGMQGARHDPYYVSCSPYCICEDTHQMCTDSFCGTKVVPTLRTMNRELNFVSSSSEDLSPNSQSTVPFFQLFGKIIYMKEPVESGSDEVGCVEDDAIKGGRDTEGTNIPLDLSLTLQETVGPLNVGDCS